jgi:hypothetical protein
MNPSRWKEVEAIFHAAVDLPPDERGNFLARRCGGDQELRREVESLLAAEAPDGQPGVTSVLRGVAAMADEPSLPAGAKLGPYRIVRALGRGGMGEVYEAEQIEPVRRRVALKLVRWGMGDSQVLARFDAERCAGGGEGRCRITDLLKTGLMIPIVSHQQVRSVS